jgi:NAD(P)-dependent dehydrogenase (short-subunit alcohol dehydrogenase family)
MAGKVIVITGANGGLGRALAQRFAQDGDKVILLGRSLAKLQEVADEIGGDTLAVECTIGSPDSVRGAFATIAQTHPKIDVLINNAAAFAPYLLEEASDDQILNSVMTNLTGPMFTSRAAIPMLNADGHIINLSSESVVVDLPHLTAYQATKAGLERFSQVLHEEIKEKGLRVTVVRAGQMVGPGQTPQVDAETGMRFFQAAIKKGLNPMERGMTQYQSVVHVFRMIVDTPADLHVGIITLDARIAG